MNDGPLDLPDGLDDRRDENVRDLAVRALSILMGNDRGAASDPRSAVEETLFNAVTGTREVLRSSVISKVNAHGVTDEEIIDCYAPRVASRLGSLWVQDKMSFAEVTVGASRLQDIVRHIGDKRRPRRTTIPLGRNVLMAVPMQENHMLGAFVAASQFRRLGLWVHMAVGQSHDELVENVACQNYEMLGLSAASRRSLPMLTELVTRLRELGPKCPPIVIGGQVLQLNVDVCDIIGADFATSNPREAAQFCGLLAEDDALSGQWLDG